MTNSNNGTGVIPTRLSQYEECHRRIAEAVSASMEDFVRVGMELARMRKLYDAGGYKTFAEYCKVEWGWSDRHAQRTMRAAEIRRHLPELPSPESRPDHSGRVLQWTEGSVRSLTELNTVAQAKTVAARVVKDVEKAQAAGEKVSLGKIVKARVDEAKARKESPPPELHEAVKKWTTQVRRMAGWIERLEGDSPQLLAQSHPGVVKDFAEAIGRLAKAWDVTTPAPGPRRKIVEVL